MTKQNPEFWQERQLADELRKLADTPALRAAEERVWARRDARRLRLGMTGRLVRLGMTGRLVRLGMTARLAFGFGVLGAAAAAVLALVMMRPVAPPQTTVAEVDVTDDDLLTLEIYDAILEGGDVEQYAEVVPEQRNADPRSLDSVFEDYSSALGRGGVILTSY